ncbi:MAG: hypothetical protein P8P74_17585 [Crocinitomicaceae bacterium]|nr:hypothetical protein [Crocinitomicaceae bacterium]
MKTMNLYLLSITLLISQAIRSQSNGCGGSPPNLPVNASCVTQTFTNNQNGTGQTVNASCAGGYGTAYQDAWYTVTGTGNPITITFSGGNRDAVLAAFTSCGAGELACATIDNGTTGSIVFPSTLATTYFIQIQRRSGNNNNNLNGDICATSTISGPANDDPCSATPLPVNATCTNTLGTNLGATSSVGVPAPGCTAYSGGDVWYTITVPPSGNVLIETSTAGGITDGGMVVYSGTCASLNLVVCDDDGGVGTIEAITLVGQTPGATLWIRIWEFGGGSSGDFDICATETTQPTNVTCDVPDPICSGTPIVFTAQANGTEASVVNPGNDYDCLLTSPNPSWYYLEISGAGNLAIDITAGSDVDFAIWGPYADLTTAIGQCDSHATPLDCSYSTSAVEQANVAGAAVGEVYILLVTNYAAVVQTITVTDAPSNTAQTDCTILPIELSDFSGEMNVGDVLLNWTTLSELNNDYFAVERSADGFNWTVFDVVDGAGTSNELYITLRETITRKMVLIITDYDNLISMERFQFRM